MSDEPQDPKLIEPQGEPTPDVENISSSGQRLPEEQLPEPPSQSTASSRAEMGEPDSRTGQPQKRDSGGLLRRLTGSLRRLTGPLGNTGLLGASGQSNKELPGSQTSSEQNMDAQEPSGAAGLPQPEWESGPEDEESADFLSEISFEPLEDLPPTRRMTGPLSDSGMVGDTGSLIAPPLPSESPQWADEIREESGEQRGGWSVDPFEPSSAGEETKGPRDALEGSGGQRRLTGSLGNSGALGDTGALPEPPQPPEETGWMNEIRWGMEEPPQAVTPEATEETPGGWKVIPQEPAEIPDLERRLTGPLSDQEPMLDTGMLHDSSAFSQPVQPAEMADLERRLTGPLGERGTVIDTGILKDTGALPETPLPPEAEELDQRLAGLPGDQGAFADTGRLGDSGPLPVMPPEPGEEDLERRLTGPLSERGPAIDTGLLGDTGTLPEPPTLPEQPNRVFWGVDQTVEPSTQAPSRADWMADLRGEAQQPEEISSQQEMTGQPQSEVFSEAEPPQPAPGWMTETRTEAGEPGQVEAQSQPEAAARKEAPVEPPETLIAPSPQPMSPLRRVTGSLRKIITGALGRSQSDQQEISDDLVAGRLENTLKAKPKRVFRPGMPVEEPADVEKPTTGSLVRRVTGSLRRVTGSLRGAAGQAKEPIQPSEPPQVIPAPWQKSVEPPKQPASSDVDWMNELRKEPERLIEEIEPQEQVAPDWTGEVREEKPLPVGEEPGEAQPVEPAGGFDLAEGPVKPLEPHIPPASPPRMSTLRRVTGSLRKLITGALGRQKQTEEQEISDDLMAGRLEHTLTSGLKRDFRSGAPVEDVEEPKKANTGSLIRRVTGSLRRITGSLYGVGAPKEPVVPQASTPWRLPPEAVKPPAETPADRGGEDQLSRDQQAGWQRDVLEEKPLSGDEPISLLESGAIAALGEAEKPAIEPDWMKSIRGETSGAEREGSGEAGKEKPGFDRMTESLRKLIADGVGGEEQIEEQDVEQAAPGLVMEEVETGGKAPVVDLFVEEEEVYDDGMAFLDGLEARFGHFEDAELPEEEISQLTTTQEGADSYDFLDTDEIRIWGEADQAVPAEPQETASEGFWAPTDIEAPPNLSQRIWGETVEEQIPEVPEPPKSRQLSRDEALAAQYLAGEDIDAPERAETRREYLREALQRSEDEEAELSVQDLRAIALEDYEETEQGREALEKARAVLAAASATSDEGAVSPVFDGFPTAGVEDTYLTEPAWSFGSWIASHSRAEKVLLIEAAVVILVLLVSVPFFVARIIRGPSAQQAGTFVTRPLSGDLPYPVSLELPGGWSFSLQKSTVSDGQWKPTAGEWLEGTELRRVVALPWNTQTEAVVRTFQAGDQVELGLSNDRTLQYEVEKVERVPVSDTSIMSDPSPALVIILFEEKTDSRWVVICKP